MYNRESLLRISTRAFIAAGTIGLACAALIINVMWVHVPEYALSSHAGSAWITSGLIALIAFVLSTGTALTVYFVFNLLRITLADLHPPGEKNQHGP